MTPFPFTAIVGMELAKRSLIYHAIDPRIGGTLLLGHRGCAKSTLVRAFAGILAAETRTPFVEVPLGATEDRLLGSVNAEALVEQGQWKGRAGLIEEANGGVLYIDEVNLLPDHLADFILDSAASGQYRMERDGITREVESRYILVGTMNPEEGDLRPQLSDRFAHGVLIRDAFEPEERMEIVERRMRFDDDPEEFVLHHSAAILKLKEEIAAARCRVREVGITSEHRLRVSEKGRELRLEGLRAELGVLRTARSAAAWHGRSMVSEEDLEEAWLLCLGHRIPNLAEPPKPPVPPPAGHRTPSRSPNSVSATSPAPLESDPGRIEMASLQPSAHQSLQEWYDKKTSAPSHLLRNRTPAGLFTRAPHGAIDWLVTVVYSFRNGWLPGHPGFRLRYRIPFRRPTVWCFLDASRSTGMACFLHTALAALAALAQHAKSARFHLLVLAHGETFWAARNSTSRQFQRALVGVHAAGGKSLIIEALKQLHRARLRKRTGPRDLVLIASDGFGNSPVHTGRRYRDSQAPLSNWNAGAVSKHHCLDPPARQARTVQLAGSDLRLITGESPGSRCSSTFQALIASAWKC